MSLFHEEWRQEAYYPRRELHLRDLPENHVKKAQTVQFKFEDYRVHNKLPCLVYDRMSTQCLNNYGVKGAYANVECHNIMKLFNQCIQIHQFFAIKKRWIPEAFAENQYSRERPSLEDIGL